MLLKAKNHSVIRMPRRPPNKCPICDEVVDKPYKTWQLISPIPDSLGRITITVMGMYQCGRGHKWRAVVSKIKVGGEGDVEVEGAKGKKVLKTKRKKEKHGGEVFEIDLEELEKEEF